MSANRRFNLIWSVTKILVAFVLVGYVFSTTNLNELASLREQMKPAYLIATILLYVFLTVFKAIIYQVVLQQNTQYLRVLNVVVLQNAISNFLASGAGFASYLTMLKVEENVRIGRSGLVFLIMKIGDLFAVWVVMLFYGIFYWEKLSVLRRPFLSVEIIVGIGFLLFFSALFLRSFFISFFSNTVDRLGLTRFSFVQQGIQGLEAFAEMHPRIVLRTVLIAFGLTFIYYIFTLAWNVVSLYVFDFQADVWMIVFVSGILQIYSILPVSIFGGMGVIEATSLYLYPLLGVSSTGLSPILLGWRILYYLTNLLVLIYLPMYTIFIEPRMKIQK